MMIFGTERDRLLRESWTANALAEELYAMFGATLANLTDSPLKITLPDGKLPDTAPIQIGNFSDGDTVFNITKNDGSTLGAITISGGQFYFNGQQMGGKGTGAAGGVPVWG